MNQIWPKGTEIWFRTDKSVDGRNGRMDGCRQNYIPPTSSGDNKSFQLYLTGHILLSADNLFKQYVPWSGPTNIQYY